MRWLVATIWLVVVAGCAAGRPTPTVSISLPANEWGEFTLEVFDESGLVVGGQAGDQGLGGVNPVGVIATPERNELEINWTGGACSHRPILRVTGDSAELHLVIAPTPVEFSLMPVSCPAVGILSSATLVLSQPVDQENVNIEEER